MSWTVSASGTDTAVVGTEQTLGSDTTNGTYVLVVDLVNMALGDTTELRVYTKVLSTGALDLMWKGTFGNVQITPVVQSPFVPSDVDVSVSLKQIAGTARTYDWKLLRQ